MPRFPTSIQSIGTRDWGLGTSLLVDVVSGTSFAKVLKQLVAAPNVRIVPVVNKFFGERVNVSGLLTGRDIIEALRGGERERRKRNRSDKNEKQSVFLHSQPVFRH